MGTLARACACNTCMCMRHVHVLWTVPWPSGSLPACLPVCLRACMCGSCAGGWPCLVVEVHVGAECGRRVGHRHGAHQRQDLNIPHRTAPTRRQARDKQAGKASPGRDAACLRQHAALRLARLVGRASLSHMHHHCPLRPPPPCPIRGLQQQHSTAASCEDVCACRSSITAWLCMALHGA